MPIDIGGYIANQQITAGLVQQGIVTRGLILNLDASRLDSYSGSGTTVYDISTTNASGTFINNTSWSNSYNSGVFIFPDGVGDAITFGTNNSLNPSGDISLEAWVYFTNFNTEWNIIATKWFNDSGSTMNSDFHYAAKATSNGSGIIKQNLYTTNNSNIYSNTTLTTNTWYLLGFTIINSGTLTFYLNGQPDGTSSPVSRAVSTNSSFLIGDPRAVTNAPIGRIGSFRYYNRALSAAEITQNFNSTRSRFGV